MRRPVRGFDALSCCGALVAIALVITGLVLIETERAPAQATPAAWQAPAAEGAADGAPPAEGTTPETAGLKYVALGSSFAAGPGEGEVTDPRCGRTADSYPSQVADELGLRLTDATCGGATVLDVLRASASHPGRPAQIESVTADTSIVTITVGGNDLRYIPRIAIASCSNVLDGTAPGAACSRGWRAPSPLPAPVAYDDVEQELVAVVNEIRDRAPGARVLLVEYLPVVSVTEAPCPALPLQPWQVDQTESVGSGLSAATAWAAVVTGAEYVSTTRAGAAHTVCSPDPWISGWGTSMPFHPNAEGKAAMADEVIRALR